VKLIMVPEETDANGRRAVPVERILEAAADPKTKIVTLSHVEYASGQRHDLTRIGQFCRDNGKLFCVDAIQSLGVLPLDVQTMKIDYLSADSEVDALLLEARLVKDIQPKHNQDLKDDKSFPYLQITTGEDFPRVNFTREPLERGVKLYGPFPRAKSLRGAIQVLQKIFKFRTCSLDIEEGDPRWRWFRPCLLHSIDQCTAPCNMRIDREAYRKDIRRLRLFLD